jgi:hypothetical protein
MIELIAAFVVGLMTRPLFDLIFFVLKIAIEAKLKEKNDDS